MKKLIVSTIAIFALVTFAFAQEQKTRASAEANSKTSVSKQDKSINLESGTQLMGELQSAIDVRKAKQGDQVVLKTTKAIKENGKVVLEKGTRLVGHVADVQQKTKSNAMSSVSIVFDRLENGSLSAPIKATITSITQATANASANNDSIMSDTETRSSTSARTSNSSSSGGGLLGGVTNTVGSVANTTTNMVGGVVNTTGETVGNTTKSLGNTVGNIRVSQSADASATGGSTLSLNGRNLKLEKGTVFRLALSESTKIGNN